ncbi:MAG: hypothetical protein AAF334_10740, partial [Pseudomonadota bacterium]
NYNTHEVGAEDLHQDWIAEACRRGDVPLLLAIREALEKDLAQATRRAERERRSAAGKADADEPEDAGPPSGPSAGPSQGGPRRLPKHDIQMLIAQIDQIFAAIIRNNPDIYSAGHNTAADADTNKQAGRQLIEEALDAAERGKLDIKGGVDSPEIVMVKAGRGPATPCVALFRMQSRAETRALESTGEVTRGAFTERCKWLSESKGKAEAFANAGASGTSASVVAILVDGDFYMRIRRDALMQQDSTSVAGYEDRYIYHREGLSLTSKMINIGIPESKLDDFNRNVLSTDRA